MHGTYGYTDDLGNFDSGESFDLEHHEHCSLVEAERVQHLREALPGFAEKVGALGVLLIRVDRSLLGCGHRLLPPQVRATPVSRGDAESNPVEPRREAGGAVEGVQLAVDDDEDFLKGVLQIAVTDSETLQGSPDEVGMVLVDLVDARSIGLCCGAPDGEHTRHESVNADTGCHPSKKSTRRRAAHAQGTPTPIPT